MGICEEIYFKELVHAIVEAWRVQDPMEESGTMTSQTNSEGHLPEDSVFWGELSHLFYSGF